MPPRNTPAVPKLAHTARLTNQPMSLIRRGSSAFLPQARSASFLDQEPVAFADEFGLQIWGAANGLTNLKFKNIASGVFAHVGNPGGDYGPRNDAVAWVRLWIRAPQLAQYPYFASHVGFFQFPNAPALSSAEARSLGMNYVQILNLRDPDWPAPGIAYVITRWASSRGWSPGAVPFELAEFWDLA